MRKVTGNNPYMPYSAQISQKQDEHNIYVIMKTYMLLCSSCFCEIWALCVSWITYDHLYYAPCLACWALFGSLYQQCETVHHVPKCMSCHKAIVVITGGTLFSWYLYYIHTIKLFPSLINCSISCTIELFNWIMVKIQLSFKCSEFHVNYFTIFSLITTLSTDVTKSLQRKGIFLANANWRHVWC